MTTNETIIIINIFLWIGFVSAISFMEAWLKFKAPGITVTLGLGIGKLVFKALNRMEWILLVTIGICIITGNSIKLQSIFFYFFIPFILLLLQTFWLLPALNARANLLIKGERIPKSNLHFYFVGMEIIKVVSLFIIGFSLLNPK